MNESKHLEEILRRKPLEIYSTEHRQQVGVVEIEKRDPRRPGVNSWLMNSWPPTYKRVPVIVCGQRIAVINPDGKSLEAISVEIYGTAKGHPAVLAKVGSVSVVFDMANGLIVGTQVRRPDYWVALDGGKVVGLTRGEYGALISLAASQA